MPRYKKGDRVVVIKIEESSIDDWVGVYKIDILHCMGQTGTVVAVYDCLRGPYRVRYKVDLDKKSPLVEKAIIERGYNGLGLYYDFFSPELRRCYGECNKCKYRFKC